MLKNALKNYSKSALAPVLLLSILLQNVFAAESGARVVAGPDIGQVVMALIFVLVLVFALAFLSKFLPAMRNNSGQNIKVIETLPLGHREKLMIIEVNQQQLLVGVSAQGMTTLHTLESTVNAAEPTQDSFAQRLVAVMQGNHNA